MTNYKLDKDLQGDITVVDKEYEEYSETYYYTDGKNWGNHIVMDGNSTFLYNNRICNSYYNFEELLGDSYEKLEEFIVRRYVWPFKKGFLFMDSTTYPDGDAHDVFITSDNEKYGSVAIRSNIHEYLFRYRKDLYDTLLTNSLIEDLKYEMSVTRFPGDKSTCPIKGFKRALLAYIPALAPDSDELLEPFNFSDGDYYSE